MNKITNIIIDILIAFFLADLLVGIIHLILDYQEIINTDLRLHIEKDTPSIKDFKETDSLFLNSSKWDKFFWNFHAHHDVPYPPADSQNLETLRIMVPSLLLLCTVYLLYIKGIVPFRVFRITLFATPLLILSQKIHFLAHARNHNKLENKGFFQKILCFMQDYNIILNPKNHKKHHETYDCNFCLVNGWANPLLNLITRLLIKINILPKIPMTTCTRNMINEIKND